MGSGQSFFPRHRFALRSLVPAPRRAPQNWHAASPVARPVICLRPTCELSADNANALVDVVSTRVRAAVPVPWSVVLDLSATPAFDTRIGPALQLLDHLLADTHTRLRAVVPGAQAHAAFCSAAGTVIRPDAVHTSVRTAMLAAYASVPGAALVTPALRELLAQPPEVLTLALAVRTAAAGARLAPRLPTFVVLRKGCTHNHRLCCSSVHRCV